MTVKILVLSTTGAFGEALAQEFDAEEAGTTVTSLTAVAPISRTVGLSPTVQWQPVASVDFRGNMLLYTLLTGYTTGALPSGLGTGGTGAVAYDTTKNSMVFWTGTAWHYLQTTALAQGAVWVGNSSDLAVARILSGDLATTFLGLVEISRVLGKPVPTPNRNGYILGYSAHTDTLAWVYNGLADPVSLDLQVTNATGATIPSLTVCTVVPGGSQARIQVASAAATGAKPGRGFAVPTFLTGHTGLLKTFGFLDGFTGLTVGQQYYLDPAVPGGITAVPTTVPGTQLQKVGVATLATQLFITFGPSILVGNPILAAGFEAALALNPAVPGNLVAVTVPDRRNFLTGPQFPSDAQLGDIFYSTVNRDMFVNIAASGATWVSASVIENIIALRLDVTAAADSSVTNRLIPFPEDFQPCYIDAIELRAGVKTSFDVSNYWSYQLGRLPLHFTDMVADFVSYGPEVTTDPATQSVNHDYRVELPVQAVIKPFATDSLAYTASTTGAPGPLHFDFATLRYRRIGTNSSSGYQAAVLASLPLAYWRMNELTGPDTVVDYSGHGKDVTVPVGCSLLVGQYEQPLGNDSFNLSYRFPGGVNSYFSRTLSEIPTNFTNTETWVTVEMWVYLLDPPVAASPSTGTSTVTDRVLFSFGPRTGFPNKLSLVLRTFNGVQTAVCWTDAGEAQAGVQIDFDPAPDGTHQAGFPGWVNNWVHIVAIADFPPIDYFTANTFAPHLRRNQVYINGVLGDINTVSQHASAGFGAATTTPLFIVGNSLAGKRDDVSSFGGDDGIPYNGGVSAYIDEVAVYTRPLDPTEILAHYNAR